MTNCAQCEAVSMLAHELEQASTYARAMGLADEAETLAHYAARIRTAIGEVTA